MKWIYGAKLSVTDKVLKSYKVRPSDIVAVDFNEKIFISRELGELHYVEDDECALRALVDGELV